MSLHADYLRLTEFKPRKAQFGFRVEDFYVVDLGPIAELVKMLKAAFSINDYTIEFGVPYKARSVSFKLYTDTSEIADFVRDMFPSCNK
jgi:hypothetical protein